MMGQPAVLISAPGVRKAGNEGPAEVHVVGVTAGTP